MDFATAEGVWRREWDFLSLFRERFSAEKGSLNPCRAEAQPAFGLKVPGWRVNRFAIPAKGYSSLPVLNCFHLFFRKSCKRC